MAYDASSWWSIRFSPFEYLHRTICIQVRGDCQVWNTFRFGGACWSSEKFEDSNGDPCVLRPFRCRASSRRYPMASVPLVGHCWAIAGPLGRCQHLTIHSPSQCAAIGRSECKCRSTMLGASESDTSINGGALRSSFKYAYDPRSQPPYLYCNRIV